MCFIVLKIIFVTCFKPNRVHISLKYVVCAKLVTLAQITDSSAETQPTWTLLVPFVLIFFFIFTGPYLERILVAKMATYWELKGVQGNGRLPLESNPWWETKIRVRFLIVVHFLLPLLPKNNEHNHHTTCVPQIQIIFSYYLTIFACHFEIVSGEESIYSCSTWYHECYCSFIIWETGYSNQLSYYMLF